MLLGLFLVFLLCFVLFVRLYNGLGLVKICFVVGFVFVKGLGLVKVGLVKVCFVSGFVFGFCFVLSRVRVRVRVSENLFCCWVCFWFFCYVLFCLLDFTTTERDIL